MSAVYRISNENLLQEVIDSEIFIIDIKGRIGYTLNASGSFIWLLLRQGCEFTTIVDLLAKECKCGVASVKEQVRGFVKQLLTARLIVEQQGAVPQVPVMPAGIIAPMSDGLNPVLNIFTEVLGMNAVLPPAY